MKTDHRGSTLPRATWLLAIALGLAPFCSALHGQTEFKVHASDGTPGNSFGDALAIREDVMVVGAQTHDSFRGAAYVYRYDGSDWVEEQKLEDLTGNSGDALGANCLLAEDYLILSVHYYDSLAHSSQGAVFAYRYDGTAWQEEQRILSSDGNSYDAFGWGCALAGDLLVVGSPFGPRNGGAAYVFGYDGTTWIEEQVLSLSNAEIFDNFGMEVCTDGEIIVVTAPEDDVNGIEDQGSAHVYRHDGVSWSRSQRLLASDGAEFDYFGSSIDLLGDTLCIGVTNAEIQGVEAQGAVYVYRFNGSRYREIQKLVAPDGAARDYFGRSCVLEEGRLIVGAPGADLEGNLDQGALYVFSDNGTTFSFDQKVEASDGTAQQHYGSHCAVSGNMLAVGARGDYSNTEGAAYVMAGLSLHADPERVVAGDSLSIDTVLSAPGGLCFLFAQEVNGVPLTLSVAKGIAGPSGRWEFGATVPPGLTGTVVDFVSFGFGPLGNVEASNPVEVSFD